MATRLHTFKLDDEQIHQLSQRLGQIDRTTLGKIAVEVLNDVLDDTYDLARERMTADINLDDAYVRSKMRLRRAREGDLRAEIVSAGGRNDQTPLGRYMAAARVVPAVSPPSRLKGFKALNIRVGAKQQGTTVSVRRSTSEHFTRGFILPLKAGRVAGGNGLGVFIRNKAKKKIHRYGPSPYQLFAYQLVQMEQDIQENLADTLATRAARYIEGALS